MATLMLTSSPPELNPAAARLHKSVTNRFSVSFPQGHRSLLFKLNPAKRLLMWKTPKRNIRKHLSLDEISHRLLPLLNGHSSLPLLNPQLVLTLEIQPPDPIPDSHTTMRKESRAILLRHWSTLVTPAPPYPFAPSLTPHTFMGLSKFIAGRIHQIRSGKSYLASHPSWFNRDLLSIRPRYWAAPETFEDAVLHCKSRSHQKELFLPTLDLLDPDSPI